MADLDIPVHPAIRDKQVDQAIMEMKDQKSVLESDFRNNFNLKNFN